MVAFTEAERDAVYKTIYARRDIRRFRDDPIPDELLERLIRAAHHAPSVGFSQPWDLVVVSDDGTKADIAAICRACHRSRPRGLQGTAEKRVRRAETRGDPRVSDQHLRDLRSDSRRTSRVGSQFDDADRRVLDLSRGAKPLAGRSSGGRRRRLGEHPSTRTRSGKSRIPPHVEPVAYLCLGYPKDGFPEEPVLQREGWRDRIEIETL